MPEGGTQSVKSVEKALRILLLFSESQRQLSNTEIAEQLGMPTPTTLRLAKTMVEMGFLTQNNENNKYMLGSKLFYLGQLAGGDERLREASEQVLARIVSEIDETAHIWIRDGIYRYCFTQLVCTQPIRQVSALGERAPLWEGATGRLLLGFQPAEVMTGLLVEMKERNPSVDLNELLMKAIKAKEAGYSKKSGKGENHVGCIAAPIFNAAGEVNACLGISMPEFRYPKDDSEWVKIVCDGAKEISRNLGYQG